MDGMTLTKAERIARYQFFVELCLTKPSYSIVDINDDGILIGPDLRDPQVEARHWLDKIDELEANDDAASNSSEGR